MHSDLGYRRSAADIWVRSLHPHLATMSDAGRSASGSPSAFCADALSIVR